MQSLPQAFWVGLEAAFRVILKVHTSGSKALGVSSIDSDLDRPWCIYLQYMWTIYLQFCYISAKSL